MRHLSAMIKPASSQCNMRCNYCFYFDLVGQRENENYGMMNKETAKIVIDRLIAAVDDYGQLDLGFQGGEPLLVGIGFFEWLVDYVNQNKGTVNISYSIQTNGILINDGWAALFKKHKFLVGLSIDGDATFHDLNRVDIHKKATFSRVLKAKQLLDLYQIEYNVLCVLTNNIAEHPSQVWNFLNQYHIHYVQFIPCLDALPNEKNQSPTSEFALTPQSYHYFYTELFNLWKQGLENDNYISIKLFDDIVNLIWRKEITACGMVGSCSIGLVIEADGSTYPCDFYALDQYRGGCLKTDSVPDVIEKMRASDFLHSRKELPEVCNKCRYLTMCHGGCKRMQSSVVNRDGFCGYQKFLDTCLTELLSVTKYLI